MFLFVLDVHELDSVTHRHIFILLLFPLTYVITIFSVQFLVLFRKLNILSTYIY